MLKKTIILIIFASVIFSQLNAQTVGLLPYQNASNDVETRVKDLLSRMTLEEKVAMVSGVKAGDLDTNPGDSPTTILTALNSNSKTKANYRLGIPRFLMTDGPLGPNRDGGSANYSSAMNYAATFDDALIEKVGIFVEAETRNMGYNMLLAPNINIARSPHNSRMFEAFGEDPYLMSRMA